MSDVYAMCHSYFQYLISLDKRFIDHVQEAEF